MSKEKIVECIFGDPALTPEEIKMLQKYFKADWKFTKSDHIYYIDPEYDEVSCKPASILYNKTNRYKFEVIHINTIKKYVNRLQEQETHLDRRDQQPTSGIQCAPSKVAIASGHLEYRAINFRRGSKAQIGKANLSF